MKVIEDTKVEMLGLLESDHRYLANSVFPAVAEDIKDSEEKLVKGAHLLVQTREQPLNHNTQKMLDEALPSITDAQSVQWWSDLHISAAGLIAMSLENQRMEGSVMFDIEHAREFILSDKREGVFGSHNNDDAYKEKAREMALRDLHEIEIAGKSALGHWTQSIQKTTGARAGLPGTEHSSGRLH